jgi:putative FmdB family regulatory protein
MPLYDYQCQNKICQITVEVSHPYNANPDQKCFVCGAEMKKILSPSLFKLKGDGFYKSGSHAK